jgi:CheY-like chemotaxis protein
MDDRIIKVLIVDDQPEMRTFLRAALKGLSVEIMEAADGIDAMNMIETEHPELLLADYHMPNWDGLTLCDQLRNRSDLKSIKIVMITGEASQPMLLEAVNNGIVEAALTKPVDLHEVQQIIKRLCTLVQSERPVLSGNGLDSTKVGVKKAAILI